MYGVSVIRQQKPSGKTTLNVWSSYSSVDCDIWMYLVWLDLDEEVPIEAGVAHQHVVLLLGELPPRAE